MNTKDKTKVLAAIKSGEYEVEIEVANTITQYTKYDGTPFLRISQNNNTQSSYFGYCKIQIKHEKLTCDLENGQWYKGKQPLKDKEIISALESAPNVIFGAHPDGFSMCELYAQLYNLPEDIDFCMEDEDFCLKDVNELGGGDAEIVIRYTPAEEDDWKEFIGTISDGDLFNIYKLLKKRNTLPTSPDDEFEMLDKYVKAEFPDLYDEIIELIEEEDENDNPPVYKFILPLSQKTFELGLYGDFINT